jgi:hypothetical protein
MTTVEHQRFAEVFLDKYLAFGFGSMPKSEIDLLVFHLLTEASEYSGKSNYELATLLQIPESRVKALRLNSSLKYKTYNPKDILAQVATRFIRSEQFTSFERGKFEISLENPIEKRELENFLKKRGFFAEYTLNTEVLRISPLRFFELIVENSENPKQVFNTLVQSIINDESAAADLMNDTLTLSQKFSRLKKYIMDPENIRLLISSAVSLFSGMPSS